MYLNLAGNKITSLQPFHEIASIPNKLKSIDLSGNSLHDLREIQIMKKLIHLKYLVFHQDEEFSNPFCQDKHAYLAAIKSLDLPSDAQIDNVYIPDLRLLNADRMSQTTSKQFERTRPRDSIKHDTEVQRNPSTVKKGGGTSRGEPPITSILNSRPSSKDRSDPEGNIPENSRLQNARNLSRDQRDKMLKVQGRSIFNEIDSMEEKDQVEKVPANAVYNNRGQRTRDNEEGLLNNETKEESKRREIILRDLIEMRAQKRIGAELDIEKKPPQIGDQFSLQLNKNFQVEFTKLLVENEKLKLEADDYNRTILQLQEDRKFLEIKLADMEKANQKEKSTAQEVEKAMRLLRVAQEELEVTKEAWQSEKHERETKEDQLQELRRREKDFARQIEDSLTRAVEVNQENELIRSQLQKSNEEIANLNGQVVELRRTIKSYELNLSTAHSDALKSNEIAIIRIEDLTTKLRESESKQAELKQQVLHLQEAKSDLFEQKVKLESSLANQLEAMKLSHTSSITSLEETHKKILSALTTSHKEELSRERANQESALNGLEQEYRGIVATANEKYKRILDENKALKESLKDSIMKNRQTDQVLDDMTKVVDALRQQYKDVKLKLEEKEKTEGVQTTEELRKFEKLVLERDEDINRLRKRLENMDIDMQKALDHNRVKAEECNGLHEQVVAKNLQIHGLETSLAQANARLQDYQANLDKFERRFELYENQAKEDEQRLLSETEDLKTELRIKNQLLLEKNAEVEKLKSDVERKENQMLSETARRMETEETMKGKLELEQLEYQKLKSKYKKKDELLDEYEGQIENLQRELDQSEKDIEKLRMELENKGKLAEDCYEKVKQMQTDKRMFEDNQNMALKELERRIEGMNSLIKKKDDRIKELESGLKEVEGRYKTIILELERKNRALTSECSTREQDINTLLYEIDKQKRLAKENLANLTKIFS